jgi:hypothetical protein
MEIRVCLILFYPDSIFVVKFMATRGLFVNVYTPGVQVETLDQLQAKYHPLTVVIDLQCAGSFALLAQVSTSLCCSLVFF